MIHGGDPLLSGTRYIIAAFLMLEPATCSDELYESMLENVADGDQDGWGLGWSSGKKELEREVDREGERGRGVQIGSRDIEIEEVEAISAEKKERGERDLEDRRNGEDGQTRPSSQDEGGRSEGVKGEERREEGRRGLEDEAISALIEVFLPFYSQDISFSVALPPAQCRKKRDIEDTHRDIDIDVEANSSVYNPALGLQSN